MAILFKAQKQNSKEWVEGNLIQFDWADFIVKYGSFEESYRVTTETVCQFVNLTDKDGVKIFSNDLRMDSDGVIFRIYSTFGGFVIKAHYWKKDISDLVSGDELIFDHLSNPQVADWVCNSTKHYGNIQDNK